MAFFSFQNSFKGLIQLDFSKNGASLRFTPVFKPISPKDIQKGMKIYNYDATHFFTITIDELIIFEKVIDSLIMNGDSGFANLAGKYGSIEVTDKSVVIIHYPQNSMSKLSLFSGNSEDGKQTLNFGFELYVNKTQQFKLYMQVGITELLIIQKYIQQVYNYITILDANEYLKWKEKKSNGYNQEGNSYNSGGNSGYNNNNIGGNSYNNNSNGNYGNNYGNNYNNNNRGNSGNTNGNAGYNNYSNQQQNPQQQYNSGPQGLIG